MCWSPRTSDIVANRARQIPDHYIEAMAARRTTRRLEVVA
jgi:hypothetical protein